MAGFGLPNFGQLTEAFKKAKQIQQDAQRLQDELEKMEIEGKSDDEMIKVWISGNQLPLKVEVQENILNANKEQIEQSILQAIQKAHELSTTTMKERMNDLTGGLNLNLPGFENSDS
nr:YbaB/EbfC family nucleoid-associated protein [Prochlorococcus marinus]